MGGSLSSGHGQSHGVLRGMDQLRVVDVAPSAIVTVASALSPGSFLFPFSDSGFASLSSASSSRSLSLPPPISCPPSSSASSSSSAPFLSSLPSPSPLPPPPSFPSLFAPTPPHSSRSSFSSSDSVPPPPPGFPPLPPSTLAPFPSSSFLPGPSPSSSYPSLPSFTSSPSGVPVAPPIVSSSSSSSSSLDFAAYQASVLGLSREFQTLARWYFQSGGSNFRAYLSAFYPHLSPDASRDFSSGSSVFFYSLRSIASSVPLPPTSLPFPALPPTVSSATLAFPQPPAPPPPAPSFPPPSAVPQAPSLGSFSAEMGWGASALGSSFGVSSAPPGFPPLSAASSSLFSVPPAPSSSLAPAAPSLAPPSSSSSSWSPSVSGSTAAGVGAAPAVPVRTPLAPDPPLPLFRLFAVPEPASVSLASASAPLSLAPLRVPRASPPFPLAPLPTLQASLLLLALRRRCLRGLVPMRFLLLRLRRPLLILRTILLLLVLPIRRLQLLRFRILRLRCLRRYRNPSALRSGLCINT